MSRIDARPQVRAHPAEREATGEDASPRPLAPGGVDTSLPYLEAEGDPGQQAQFLLFYDELTGLYNRRFYNRSYAEQTAAARDAGTPMALILIDVDFFKSINDRYGHQQGDAILTGVGRVINETIATGGYPIRYAGDEFVVLLPGVSAEGATEYAEKLATRAREEQFKLLNTTRHVQITFSVGVAHFPENTDDPEKLFENADHAAYIAKRNGRDRVINYQAGAKHVLDATTLYHYFPCPTLVARGSLVDDLMESLAQSTRGRVPWCILAGNGGVGKSRLLHEFRSRIDRQRRVLLQAVGLPYRMSQPFGLLLDALGTHIRDNPQDGQQMASALSAAEISALSKLLPDLSRYALLVPDTAGLHREDEARDPYLEAFCKMLLGLGEGRSPCLILDDFHQADQGTMKVLELLRERDPHVFVCMGMRNDPDSMQKNPVLAEFLGHIVGSGAGLLHELNEFGEAEVREMVEAILPDAAPYNELITLVWQKSHGIPLVVEEVLKFLIHQRCIFYAEGKMVVRDLPAQEIPTETGALLEARTEQVDDDIRQLMSRAAVIGSDFDFSTLMMLEGRDEGYLRGIIERARKAHIISEVWSEDRDHISFISAQTHLAFYMALDEEERRKLHLKMARVRQRQYANTLDSALSELAYHFSRGGESDRAQQYLKIISELYGQYASTDVVVVGKAEDVASFIEGPLPEALLSSAIDVARTLKLCMQNIRMYGSEYVKRKGGFEEVVGRIDELLGRVETLTLSEADGRMLVNGTPLPPQLSYANALLENFRAAGVKGLTFHSGLTGGELRACLEFINLGREEIRSHGGLEKLLEQVGVEHIVPNEKVYVAIGERDILVKKNASGQEVLIKQVDGEAAEAPTDDEMTTVFRGKARPNEAGGDDIRDQIEQLKALMRQGAVSRQDDPSGEGSGGNDAPDVGALEQLLTAQAQVAEWRKEVARYADLNFLNSLNRDWTVLLSDLESANPMKIAAASKVYQEAEDEAIEPLLRAIATTRDERARRVAAWILRRLTLEALDHVMFALHATQRSDEKVNLIAILEDFDDPTVSARLEALLRNGAGEVRRAALAAVAKRSHGRLERHLLDALDDPRSEVKVDVIDSLGMQKIPLAVEPLSRIIARQSWLFFERDPAVQAAACHSLGMIGDSRAIPALLAALARGGLLHRTKPADVRGAAAMALCAIPSAAGDSAVRRTLQRASRDRDVVVRSTAKIALDKLQRREGAPAPAAGVAAREEMPPMPVP